MHQLSKSISDLSCPDSFAFICHHRRPILFILHGQQWSVFPRFYEHKLLMPFYNRCKSNGAHFLECPQQIIRSLGSQFLCWPGIFCRRPTTTCACKTSAVQWICDVFHICQHHLHPYTIAHVLCYCLVLAVFFSNRHRYIQSECRLINIGFALVSIVWFHSSSVSKWYFCNISRLPTSC